MPKTTQSSTFVESISTPWFGVTMGLLGIIVGYSIALGIAPTPVQIAAQPTPVAPSVPTPAPAAPTAGEVEPVTAEDWIYGDPNAEISLIEWSDAECPFCIRHHPTPKAVVDQSNGKVNWVYRHFPLSFHPNAQKSAEAQECAGFLAGNDAFWDYTDELFAKGAIIANLTDYATTIGIDKAKFEDCLNTGKFADEVARDMANGSKAGVTGTPGNVVLNNKTGDSRLVSGAQPVAAFTAAVDALLAK